MLADDVIRHLRAPDQSGMGRVETTGPGSSNIDHLLALDQRALTVRVFDARVVPGNLQTQAYSGSVIQAAHPKLPHYEVSRWVQLKEQRTRAFLRRTLGEDLKAAWFVIGERAVTHCLSREDHASQLQHLLMLSAHEKIVIQVVPERTVVSGMADQFALYGLEGDRRVGYVETIMGSWYSTRLDDVAKLHSTFSNIAREALAPEPTRNFIREVLNSWQSAKRKSPEPTRESTSSSPRTPLRALTALESQERAWGWRQEP